MCFRFVVVSLMVFLAACSSGSVPSEPSADAGVSLASSTTGSVVASVPLTSASSTTVVLSYDGVVDAVSAALLGGSAGVVEPHEARCVAVEWVEEFGVSAFSSHAFELASVPLRLSALDFSDSDSEVAAGIFYECVDLADVQASLLESSDFEGFVWADFVECFSLSVDDSRVVDDLAAALSEGVPLFYVGSVSSGCLNVASVVEVSGEYPYALSDLSEPERSVASDWAVSSSSSGVDSVVAECFAANVVHLVGVDALSAADVGSFSSFGFSFFEFSSDQALALSDVFFDCGVPVKQMYVDALAAAGVSSSSVACADVSISDVWLSELFRLSFMGESLSSEAHQALFAQLDVLCPGLAGELH